MFRRFRRRRRIPAAVRLMLILTMLLVLGLLLFELTVRNIQSNIIENRALALAEKSVNSAVSRFISQRGDEHGEFITISYGPNGEIEAVTTNSMAVNAFKAEVDLMIQEELEKIHTSQVSVPIGAFTGVTLLSNVGPKITFTYFLTASVHSDLKSDFLSGGINQTVHRIELEIEADFILTCLGHDNKMPFSTNFEIAETVIAGDVPNAYVKGAGQVDLSSIS